MQYITANIDGRGIRYDELDGRQFLVVPVAMLTEGVHVGSNGALFYPREELSKTPAVWNHKPIVVYHPEINGQGVSACDPAVINSRAVGLIMNTAFVAKTQKLRAEAWLDVAKVRKVDSRIMDAIEKNQVMEVSTGLFTDNEATEGEFNGEKYSAIARNYRADHLAILPDKVGACSIADGAGLLQLNEQSMVNGMSFDQIRRAIATVVYAKGDGYYVEDVYRDFAVYSDGAGKLWKQVYAIVNGAASLVGDPEQVIRVTEYRSLDGSFVGNTAPERNPLKKESKTMDKKTLIDKLVGNAKSGIKETDREALALLSETALQSMVTNAEGQPAATTVTEEPAATTVTEAPAAPPPAANQKPVTMEEYVSAAPAELRDVLISSLNVHNQHKQELVAKITANKANVFTPEQLGAKSLGELQAIAALAATAPGLVPVPSYFGAAQPIANAGTSTAETPLGLPAMDFTKK